MSGLEEKKRTSEANDCAAEATKGDGAGQSPCAALWSDFRVAPSAPHWL